MRLELIVLATISGAALQLNWLAASDAQVSIGGVILQVLIGIVLMLFIFFALYAIGNMFVKRLPQSHDAKTRYSRYSSYTFGVFLLFLLGIWGLEFSKFPLALVVFIWLIAQLFLVIFLLDRFTSHMAYVNKCRVTKLTAGFLRRFHMSQIFEQIFTVQETLLYMEHFLSP